MNRAMILKLLILSAFIVWPLLLISIFLPFTASAQSLFGNIETATSSLTFSPSTASLLTVGLSNNFVGSGETIKSITLKTNTGIGLDLAFSMNPNLLGMYSCDSGWQQINGLSCNTGSPILHTPTNVEYTDSYAVIYYNDVVATSGHKMAIQYQTNDVNSNPFNFFGYSSSTCNFRPSQCSSFDPTKDIFISFNGNSPFLPDGQTPPITPTIDFNTRFLDATVSGASTTVNFDIDYFLNTSEFQSNTRTDAIQIVVLANGFFNDQQVASERRFILPLSNGTSTKNIPIDHTFNNGNYIAYVNFYNVNTDSLTFFRSNIVIDFAINGGIVSSFDVVEITNGLGQSQNVQYQDCSFTNIFGCVVNALIYTFVPQNDIFDSFSDVYATIENKPPFAYYTATTDLLSISTSTSAFTFGTVPFQTEIFDPIRDGVSGVIILAYIYFFTSRLFKINI